MSASSSIRRRINSLRDDELINNRELLEFANRSTVDRLLHEMCKDGRILREAHGIYRKVSNAEAPTIEKLAHFKAKAFNRKIAKPFVDCAIERGLYPESEKTDSEFITDGHTSSFATTRGVRIQLIRKCPRKVALDDNNEVECTIKALWFFGNPLNPMLLQAAAQYFLRPQMQEMMEKSKLMPAYMADLFNNRGIKAASQRHFTETENDARGYRFEDFVRLMAPESQSEPITDEERLTLGRGDGKLPASRKVDWSVYDGELGYDGDSAHFDGDFSHLDGLIPGVTGDYTNLESYRRKYGHPSHGNTGREDVVGAETEAHSYPTQETEIADKNANADRDTADYVTDDTIPFAVEINIDGHLEEVPEAYSAQNLNPNYADAVAARHGEKINGDRSAVPDLDNREIRNPEREDCIVEKPYDAGTPAPFAQQELLLHHRWAAQIKRLEEEYERQDPEFQNLEDLEAAFWTDELNLLSKNIDLYEPP